MTNGQRTVAGMLAVVAVMLGLNLIVSGPRVVARPLGADDEYTGISVSMVKHVGGMVFRMRSDGSIEIRGFDTELDWLFEWKEMVPVSKEKLRAKEERNAVATARFGAKSLVQNVKLYFIETWTRLEKPIDLNNLVTQEGLIDPWGNKYVMRVPSQPAEEGEFYIVSAGPDGKMGTEDDISKTGWVSSYKR